MNSLNYDGNIHPDEWINNVQRYFKLKKIDHDCLSIAISFVDPIITLPAEIDSLEKLCSVLKEDISFTIFKNTNERMLRSLKYVPENKGGNTSKFISKFRKLCYNAEINDIEEQKKYLYNSLSLPKKHIDSISIEFYKKMENVDSIKLIKEFEDFVVYFSNENLCYKTGNNPQLESLIQILYGELNLILRN
ncbi:hypothetical protein GLOIN_2v1767419 [Rhizophagus clarus]|uniref:MIR domain-containing protein n=1 Tax=Rhizophagus clarus TaxID=94130 RepID=A0A8H3LXS0_9GLOM|nr:hypothetical protein GLOIN_2v1767419 [Rhizophagus clarus]